MPTEESSKPENNKKDVECTLKRQNAKMKKNDDGEQKHDQHQATDTTTASSSEKKQKNKGKSKGKSGNKVLSPEEVAKVRAKRKAAKEAKKASLEAPGADVPPELRFIRRPILTLHDGEPLTGFQFSLMTYNCLAQALIRRKMFPDGGDALKWHRRSQVLKREFKHYNADVICLQEIDYIQYENFWKSELEKLGYDTQFNRNGTKNHGVSIAWKRDLFFMTDRMFIDYDKEASGDIPPRTVTKNVGLVLSLKFTEKARQQFPNKTIRSGIIIGTTHLFWHPFGTYERTRQCFIILKKMKEFMHRVNVLQNDADNDLSHWWPFFCGDFNSQPYDAPYLSMTSKPIEYKDRALKVIQCSTSYTFSKLREGINDGDEENGNVEKFGKNQPETPVPAEFNANEQQKELVKEMEQLQNSLDMRAISLYSVAYKKVHAENSGLDNDRGEPEISNWAHTWRGLLDYLFLIKDWDFSDKKEVGSLNSFEKENSLRIRGLLRMPSSEEMTEHGQPHVAEYPSDHLCMICKLELLP
ncbi:hypothetical protein HG535_0C05690 [Zygotorulaspora mrakii]|uniref:Endonuclease/exonuclease/phosphatase domain-containing protein n=1 Tax=Zygotorulaspora mrakii TaxID=42260 RepID=A0A7H9B0K6_ZYGMR|nr:uncharacterized protein HG535_0C05690 [Zygotorulaspora mrakii]QLG72215.1 hypothetical protein HG535_0C05690 [Zygotorulaspora mrakii]